MKSYPRYGFFGGVGAQDRRPIFNSKIKLVFEKGKIKIEAGARIVIAFAKLAIQTLGIVQNKHTLNQSTLFNN
jgi:hypothetical protein